jgi:hypothetical protein
MLYISDPGLLSSNLRQISYYYSIINKYSNLMDTHFNYIKNNSIFVITKP